MSRWKMLDTWDRDLPGLTEDQLINRLRLAQEYEAFSNRPPRNAKVQARRQRGLRHRVRRHAHPGLVDRRTSLMSMIQLAGGVVKPRPVQLRRRGVEVGR